MHAGRGGRDTQQHRDGQVQQSDESPTTGSSLPPSLLPLLYQGHSSSSALSRRSRAASAEPQTHLATDRRQPPTPLPALPTYGHVSRNSRHTLHSLAETEVAESASGSSHRSPTSPSHPHSRSQTNSPTVEEEQHISPARQYSLERTSSTRSSTRARAHATSPSTGRTRPLLLLSQSHQAHSPPPHSGPVTPSPGESVRSVPSLPPVSIVTAGAESSRFAPSTQLAPPVPTTGLVRPRSAADAAYLSDLSNASASSARRRERERQTESRTHSQRVAEATSSGRLDHGREIGQSSVMAPLSRTREETWSQSRGAEYRDERRQGHLYSSARGPAQPSGYSSTPIRSHDLPTLHSPAPALSQGAYSTITEHGRPHVRTLPGPGVAPGGASGSGSGSGNPAPSPSLQSGAHNTSESWRRTHVHQERWGRQERHRSDSGSETGDDRQVGISVSVSRPPQTEQPRNSLGLTISPPRARVAEVEPSPVPSSGTTGEP